MSEASVFICVHLRFHSPCRCIAAVCVVLAALLAGGIAAGDEAWRATSDRSFADVARWRAVFEAPGRDEWQQPERVVAALGLQPGQAVADLGAGTGYFVPHLAAAVGDTGTVYAVEIEPNLVTHLRGRAEEENLARVVPILASPDNPRLPAHGADVVLIVDTYHHLDRRREYLATLEGALAAGGRIAIIDWKKKPLPEGPPPDHKLAEAQVVTEMTAAGFELIESPDFLPYQYFLIFGSRQGS